MKKALVYGTTSRGLLVFDEPDFPEISYPHLFPTPQALVTEYTPGAPIGWHRDKNVFGRIVGISLLSACMFQLRRRFGD